MIYTGTYLSPLGNILLAADEIGLTMKSNGLVLPCGISGRWQE